MQGTNRSSKIPRPLINLNNNGEPRPILVRKPSSAASEIYCTELKYIVDLSKIVTEYIPQMYSLDLPKELKHIQKEIVFGNIEAIYNWHNNDFRILLQRCIKDPSKFGIKMEEIEKTMLSLYVKYFKNKPVSEYIIKTHESFFRKISEKFGNSFQIKSYLQYPIDRIFKYKLLFCSILKDEPNYESELNKAIDVMDRIITDVNNLMVLWRLTNFPKNEKIDDQGKLLRYAPFFCSEEHKGYKCLGRIQKRKRLQVFLLEESIIFAQINGDDNSFNLVSYEYHYHIKVSQIKDVERHSDSFKLKFEDTKEKDLIGYIIYTENKELIADWHQAITVATSSQEKFKSSILTPV